MSNTEHDGISLREYIDLNNRMRDQARDIAFSNMERRLDGLNELRREVIQDRSGFVTKIEFDSVDKSQNQRLEALERWQARMVGIGAVLVILAGLIGAAAMKLFSR